MTYPTLAVHIRRICRYNTLNGPGFHSDDPTGDSPQPGPPSDDGHGPVPEGLCEGAAVEEPRLPLPAAAARPALQQQLGVVGGFSWSVLHRTVDRVQTRSERERTSLHLTEGGREGGTEGRREGGREKGERGKSEIC